MGSTPGPFCLFPGQADGASVVAWAGHRGLAERLSEVLRDAAVPHSRADRVFTIDAPDTASRQRLARVLTSGLSAVEQRLIRLHRGQAEGINGSADAIDFAKITETEWFDQALADDAFRVYYQPLVDVSGEHQNFGYECLIRLEAERVYSGLEIVGAAALRGGILDFDAYARRKALRSAFGRVARGTKLFVNFFPSAVFDPRMCLKETIDEIDSLGIDRRDLVFEIVESDVHTDPAHTRRVCDYLRHECLSYAIDDFGAGNSDEDLLLSLLPDYVKIDKALIWNLDQPDVLARVERVARLSNQLEFRTIAEGLETGEQAAAVRSLGITLMQGYFFGKPSPLPDRTAEFGLRDSLMTLGGAISSFEPAPAPASAEDSPRIPS